MTLPLPRFVVVKPRARGGFGFYFYITNYYRSLGCAIPNEPLGDNYMIACGHDGKGGRAAVLNALFDEWRAKRNGEPVVGIVKFGTVDWLFREFKQSLAYQKRVSARTRPDYERTMLLVADLLTKKEDRLGDRKVKAITPVSADLIYERIVAGPRGPRPRQGEKVIALCRRAWRVVHRLYPDQFNSDMPNPWDGVTKDQRVMATKPAATREEVYKFAWGAIEAGYPEAGAAAVICFEWLQRPENVLAGYVRWPDYRGASSPGVIWIEHHKTGAKVQHPLEEQTADGKVLFYSEAEAVLAKVPRRGIPIVLRQYRDGTIKPWNSMRLSKVVRDLRAKLALPATFTLDACRHGGMTELEEAELTDGQGRALSAHRSRAYEGYAKRTLKRALAATRKRHAWRLTNESGTEFRNEVQFGFRNDGEDDDTAIA
jgi:hypothetical protein